MKKISLAIVLITVFVLVLTACGDFSGREYDAKVIEFTAVESKSESIGYKVSIILDTPDGDVTIKFKDVDFEDFKLVGQRATQITAGKATTTFSITEVTFLFTNGKEITVKVDENVEIREKRKNVWTIVH